MAGDCSSLSGPGCPRLAFRIEHLVSRDRRSGLAKPRHAYGNFGQILVYRTFAAASERRNCTFSRILIKNFLTSCSILLDGKGANVL